MKSIERRAAAGVTLAELDAEARGAARAARLLVREAGREGVRALRRSAQALRQAGRAGEALPVRRLAGRALAGVLRRSGAALARAEAAERRLARIERSVYREARRIERAEVRALRSQAREVLGSLVESCALDFERVAESLAVSPSQAFVSIGS